MLRTTTIVVGVAALVAALTVTFTSRASNTATPNVTHMGRTAFQWHQIAVARRVERDHARSRAGEAIRYNRTLLRTIRTLHRKISARDTVLTSPLERNFLCIHGYEGSWTDPNAPFYGGLQMDDEFQRTYGPEFYKAWGSADHWPVSVQMAVAIKAYLTRGYWPWPNTARYCGLL